MDKPEYEDFEKQLLFLMNKKMKHSEKEKKFFLLRKEHGVSDEEMRKIMLKLRNGEYENKI